MARVWDSIFFAPHAAKVTVIQMGMGIMSLKEKPITQAAAEDDVGQLSRTLQDIADCRAGFRDILQCAQGRYGCINASALEGMRVRAAVDLANVKAKREAFLRTQRDKLEAMEKQQATPAHRASTAQEDAFTNSPHSKRKVDGMMSPATDRGWVKVTSSAASSRSESTESNEDVRAGAGPKASPIPVDRESQFDQYNRRIGADNPRHNRQPGDESMRTACALMGFAVDGRRRHQSIVLHAWRICE